MNIPVGTYEKYNPNPDTRTHKRGSRKGKKLLHSDCVVRAFTLLFGLNWTSTYLRLTERGLRECDIFTVPEVYTTFLDKVPMELSVPLDEYEDYFHRRSRKPTVREVAALTKGNRKVYLCASLNHVVVCKNGKYYDSWDSGWEKVCSVWQIKKEEINKIRQNS